MTAREQVNDLKQQAIKLLLEERRQIDEELATLGYDQEKPSEKRRGRPPKRPHATAEEEVTATRLDQSESRLAGTTVLESGANQK